MKRFQCYNDFKTAIKQEDIPPIDEKLMINKIYSKLDAKAKYNTLKIASIIFSLILLSTGSVAIAKNFYVYLFNDKGEKVFTVGKLSNEQIKKDSSARKLRETYSKILHEAEKNTLPNEQTVVVIKEMYELDGIINAYQNNKYKNLTDFKKNTSTKLRLPIELPKGLSINDISADFKTEVDEEFIKNYKLINKDTNKPEKFADNYCEYLWKFANKLYEDCKLNNKTYSIGKQKITNDIECIKFYINFDKNYSKKSAYDHSILVMINRHKAAISSNFDEKNVEKIKIGNKEAILEKNTRYSVTTYNLTYVDNYNNENFTYELHGILEDEKDLAIDIIKNLQ